MIVNNCNCTARAELLRDAPPIAKVGHAAADTVTAVFSDSREAPRHGIGGLFVAIPGARFDGHDFVQSVYEAGCRMFAVSHPIPLPMDALQLIYPDTRIALAALSASFYRHPSRELTVIGITGTKGKTTTALITQSLLTQLGVPTGYIGTIGIRYGDTALESTNTTPESLILQRTMREMLDSGIRVLVMEVSSQALLLNRVYGISFEVAVFTNLYPDHIGPTEHPDFASYRAAKRKLFTDFGAKHILLNADDPNAFGMLPVHTSEAVKTVSVAGNSPDSRLPLPSLVASAPKECATDDGYPAISFRLSDGNAAFHVTLPLPGLFNTSNALLALSICRSLGRTVQDCIPYLASVSVPGRCEPIRTDLPFRILIDYAHNEASLREILTALRPYTQKRLIVLFGSVGGRTQSRRKPMGAVASALADFCILTSDNPDKEPPEEILEEIRSGFTRDCPYVIIPDREKAITYALRTAESGDVLLLAGKGHETYQLINTFKLPFSERKIVEAALQALLPQKM